MNKYIGKEDKNGRKIFTNDVLLLEDEVFIVKECKTRGFGYGSIYFLFSGFFSNDKIEYFKNTVRREVFTFAETELIIDQMEVVGINYKEGDNQ